MGAYSKHHHHPCSCIYVLLNSQGSDVKPLNDVSKVHAFMNKFELLATSELDYSLGGMPSALKLLLKKGLQKAIYISNALEQRGLSCSHVEPFEIIKSGNVEHQGPQGGPQAETSVYKIRQRFPDFTLKEFISFSRALNQHELWVVMSSIMKALLHL